MTFVNSWLDFSVHYRTCRFILQACSNKFWKVCLGLKLESSVLTFYFNPSKAWNFNPSENNNKQLISSFRRVEISSFRRVEISKQTNAKADDSNLRIKTQKAVRRWGGECEWGLRLSFHKYFSSQDSTVSGFVAKIGKILRKVCKKNLKRIDGHENFYIEANLRKQSGHCEFWYRDM